MVQHACGHLLLNSLLVNHTPAHSPSLCHQTLFKKKKSTSLYLQFTSQNRMVCFLPTTVLKLLALVFYMAFSQLLILPALLGTLSLVAPRTLFSDSDFLYPYQFPLLDWPTFGSPVRADPLRAPFSAFFLSHFLLSSVLLTSPSKLGPHVNSLELQTSNKTCPTELTDFPLLKNVFPMLLVSVSSHWAIKLELTLPSQLGLTSGQEHTAAFLCCLLFPTPQTWHTPCLFLLAPCDADSSISPFSSIFPLLT
jgi:hypothetical protein